MATFPGIHLRLAMGTSYLCGLLEQKGRPEMARMEKRRSNSLLGGLAVPRARPATTASCPGRAWRVLEFGE
jgi:hypothetical protein